MQERIDILAYYSLTLPDSLAVTAVKLTNALTSVDKLKSELNFHTKSTVDLYVIVLKSRCLTKWFLRKEKCDSLIIENHQLKSSVKSLSEANQQLVKLYQSHSMLVDSVQYFETLI